MQDKLLKSLEKNLDNYCKTLSDAELAELTDFLLYGCYNSEPNEWVKEFIDDFFDFKEWEKNLSDEVNPPQNFFKANRNTSDLIRTVRLGLLELSFHRFNKTVKNNITQLDKTEKLILKDILTEHKAMLEYQLEDEDFTRNSDKDGEAFLEEKKKHVEFINKFGNVNFL